MRFVASLSVLIGALVLGALGTSFFATGPITLDLRHR